MGQLTWLVTGCTSGLGEQFIRSILDRGDKAIATCRGDRSRLTGLAKAGAKTYRLDVAASQDSIDDVVYQMIKENGPIDVLVNNAGYAEIGVAEEASYENYLAQFDTNFFGVAKMTNAALPHFRERRSGAIVIVGSLRGISGAIGGAPYCATKFALEGWYECLKQEIAHLNIRCMLFQLGFFRTNIYHPSNVQLVDNAISDYDSVRTLVEQSVQRTYGDEPGDPKKAVEIMLDVVRGEGVAQGKILPSTLPLGPDALTTMREKSLRGLQICDEWEDVICSTDFDV